MSKVIGVLSGKGGVGKTTVVANLGAALTQEFNRKVIIVDGNLTTSHLGLHLGLYEDLPITIRDVFTKKIPVIQAIFVHPKTGVRILPAPLNGLGINISKFDKIVNKLRDSYEIIILDCAPGLGKEVVLAADSVDKALIVTTPELPAVTDALKTINLLEKLEKDILGIVLNRVKNEKYELSIDEIETTCNYKIISIVPEDKKVPVSIAKGMPVVLTDPNSSVSISIKRLAASLIGEEYTPTGISYFFKKLFGLVPERKRIPTGITTDFLKEIPDLKKLREELKKEIKKELKRSMKKKVTGKEI